MNRMLLLQQRVAGVFKVHLLTFPDNLTYRLWIFILFPYHAAKVIRSIRTYNIL